MLKALRLTVLLLASALWIPGAGAATGNTVKQFGALQDAAVGARHVCVLNKAGKIYCWGDNSQGQLRVPKTMGKALQISAWSSQIEGLEWVKGGFTTCSLNDQGRVNCWGYIKGSPFSRFGRMVLLGDGCAVTVKRALVCMYGDVIDSVPIPDSFGKLDSFQGGCLRNTQGECGLINHWPEPAFRVDAAKQKPRGELCQVVDCGSSLTPQNLPSQILDSQILNWDFWEMPSVQACVLDPHGRPFCWGEDASDAPSHLHGLSKLWSGSQVTTTFDYAGRPDGMWPNTSFCALNQSRYMRCWGNNSHGQLNPLPGNPRLRLDSVVIGKGENSSLLWPRRTWDVVHGWFNQPYKTDYIWQKEVGSKWKNTNQHNLLYRLQPSDRGKRMRVCGTARNRYGIRTICSAVSAIIPRRSK